MYLCDVVCVHIYLLPCGVVVCDCAVTTYFQQSLQEQQLWEHLHRLPLSGDPMPCTALAVCGGEGGTGTNIITGGEDGRIAVLRTHDLQPLSVIGVCVCVCVCVHV